MPLETDSTIAPHPAAPGSDASREWLGGLRKGLKARLFADPDQTQAAGDRLPVDPRASPSQIGRYVVIKRIGAGGMGLVYAAYDDRLDRKVAVKLLRPGHGAVSDVAKQRLLREAKAIAKLDHRAIVQVYEAGTHDDDVFIAMEYVEGVTLKQWQPSRGWREILARYVDAARGLAAAHKAGIVHRDFKADNVLVRTSDLAVRVLDFGLASTQAQPQDDLLDSTQPSEHEAPISLTHTGMVMGTPAYMAPEQHLALPTDPRTDQFSFCASLFEALYGYRPFAGERLEELRANVLAGHVEPAPRYTQVPAPIYRVLLRGLSVDPRDRFPTTRALLDALHVRERGRRWARRITGVAAVGLVGIASFVYSGTRDEQLLAEGVRLRAEFNDTRTIDASSELARLHDRSMSQRWDDLVLAYAKTTAPDSTAVLAALQHLSADDPRWLPEARALAADAMRGGPVFEHLPLEDRTPKLRFAPDGSALAIVTSKGTLSLWDVAARREAHPVDLEGAVRDASFGSDGALWLAMHDGHVLSLGPGGSVRERIDVADVALQSIAAHPQEDRWAVGDDAGVVHVFDGGTRSATLRDHRGAVRTLAFDPQANALASADAAGAVRIWFLDRDTHRSLEVDGVVERLAWPSGAHVLLAQTPRGVWTWDGKTGTQVAHEYDPAALGVAVSPQQDTVLERHRPRITLSLDEHSRVQLDRSEGAHSMVLSANARWAAAAFDDGVRIWRAGEDEAGVRPTGERVVDLEPDAIVVDLHAFDDKLFATSSAGRVFAIDPDDSVQTIADTSLVIHAATANASGRHLALEDESGGLHVFDLESRSPPLSLAGASSAARGPFVWLPHDKGLFKLGCSASGGCQVARHALHDNEIIPLGSVTEPPLSLHASPSGELVATVHHGHVMVWSIESSGQVESLTPATPPQSEFMSIVALSFVEDEAVRFATVESTVEGETLMVWQSDTGRDRVEAVLEEPQLGMAIPLDHHEGLVMRASDGRDLLWRLDAESFVRLPDHTLDPLEGGGVASLSPTHDRLRLEPASGGPTVLIDLDTGLTRHVAPRVGAAAWTHEGSLVDVIELHRVRRWDCPAPTTTEAFTRWLETRTRLELPLSALR